MNPACQPVAAPGPAARPASALPAGAAQRLALVYRLILDRAAERGSEMGGRIGRGQQDFLASSHQLDSNGRRERGLADPAFAHGHHQSGVVAGERVNQRT